MKDPKVEHYDLVIVGGGLAGGLFLTALQHHHPHISTLLVERSPQLGGNHTWCLHEGDIPERSRPWFLPLLSHSWDRYEVFFPSHHRVLERSYHCLKSEDFAAKIASRCGSAATSKPTPPLIRLNSEVTGWKKDSDGETLLEIRGQGPTPVAASKPTLPVAASKPTLVRCHSVIMAGGWQPLADPKSFGWQKFVGLEVRLQRPHDLRWPILKDVRVPQIDGYRFFYTLPFSSDQLLIEDTYYSNHPGLRVERIEREIYQYAERQGWRIGEVLRRETGALPLAMNPPAMAVSEWPVLGAQSNYFHPVTGYTLPFTLRMIQDLMDHSNLTVPSMQKVMQLNFHRDERRFRFLAMLNRMMFLAAKSETRYRILERFYRLPLPLIERFYSGKVSLFDQIRILAGKPPVPLGAALKAVRRQTKVDENSPAASP
ncbi:MAG: lycopene cyclase [Bdellovibrio sp.]|nr:MAG: lycopene cyclase [Bdellovibrio sp.]